MSKFSDQLRLEVSRLVHNVFHEIYGSGRSVKISQNVGWNNELNFHVFTFHTTTGPVLHSLVKAGITIEDLVTSKKELVCSDIWSRKIFTPKEYSDDNYDVKITVKPWGDVQIEVSCCATDNAELTKVKDPLKRVIAEFQEREARYNADQDQLDKDAVALTIGAKLNARVGHNETGVHLNLGLLRITGETFVTKIIEGLPDDIDLAAKESLTEQILKSLKSLKMKETISKRLHIDLDWPAAKTLALTATRCRNIEASTQPGTQASRG